MSSGDIGAGAAPETADAPVGDTPIVDWSLDAYRHADAILLALTLVLAGRTEPVEIVLAAEPPKARRDGHHRPRARRRLLRRQEAGAGMTSAYPLSWPVTTPRTAAGWREKGAFKTSLAGALGNVESSLKAFGRDSGMPVANIVLSSNVSLGVNSPADPGIAVWFLWDGELRCIPVDRYTTPAANLQAIHHVLEARRTELRHGTLHLVRATFTGLRALPPPTAGRPWFEVLELTPTASPEQIRAAHRRLAVERHPDRGGSPDAMAELNRARDEGLKERGA